MKKLVSTVASLSVIAGAMVGLNVAPASTVSAAASQTAVAEYVSLTKAPEIDGLVDEVWGNPVEKIPLAMDGVGNDAKMRVLWNETGLYFLAEISDTTVNVSDRVGFWVSEEYDVCVEDPSALFCQIDGSWRLQLNYEGQDLDNDQWNMWGVIMDMRNKYAVACTHDADSYTIELYVPLVGESSSLAPGEKVAFNFHVDDYITEGDDSTKGWYSWIGSDTSWWDNPGLLGKLELVDLSAENGQYGVDDSGNEGGETGGNEGGETPTSDKDGGNKTGLIIAIVASVVAVAGAIFGWIIFKKKKSK